MGGNSSADQPGARPGERSGGADTTADRSTDRSTDRLDRPGDRPGSEIRAAASSAAAPADGALLNPANALTLARIPLAFIFLGLYQQGAPGPARALLALAWAAALAIELTDLADGWVARRLGCVTDFGKLVDPFCDAFSRLVAFFALAGTAFAGGAPLLPLWMPALLLLRDLAVAFVRTVAAARGVVVAARASGKAKALVQGPVILLIVGLALLAPARAPALAPWLAGVAVLVTGWSLVDYVAGHRALFLRGGAA